MMKQHSMTTESDSWSDLLTHGLVAMGAASQQARLLAISLV
ncbi:hypothetical protein [Chamaesiphon minutus]|nr:hypothetical protein [Chamaesiphon minutus]